MALLPFEVPSGLLAQGRYGGPWVPWLDGLARLVRDLADEWELTFDGPPSHGHTAIVVPVRTAGGAPAVLKVGFPHDEADHEALGLQHWHGNGSVRLLRADPARYAMVLERLHAEDLRSVDVVEACEIVGRLYGRLHVPALPQLRTLSSYVARWTDDLAALPADAPIPRRLVEQAVSLGRDLVSDPTTDARMIHGDLHYENVLAADREPWLVIDPKPVAGDPHYEVAPMLWNRWDEVVATPSVRDAVRERFFAVVDAAMLDEHRARDWAVVREVHNALWCVQDARSAGLALDAEDRAYITRAITIAKAVQD